MIRIKRSSVNKKKHKKIIRLNKGFRGSHSRLFRTANQQNKKSLVYAYVGRKMKKRTIKRLWIKRINNNPTENNIKYNLFKNTLKQKNILLNTKILAKIIELDPKTIKKL